MKSLFFISLLLFSITFAQSQEQNTSNKYIVKFSVLDLLTGFQFQSSTIQFGVEKSISDYISINTELGYLFYIGGKDDILSVKVADLSGFTFETEIRKYIDDEKLHNVGQYFSASLLYRYIDAKNIHSDLEPPFEGASLFKWVEKSEEYSTYRNECALHFKYGYQNVAISGFTSDFSVGIGCRYISSRTNSRYTISPIEYEFPYSKPFIHGSKFFFSVTAAVRLGLAIK